MNNSKCQYTDNPSYILKNIREALGMSVKEIHEGLCCRSTYDRYESGENEISLTRLFFLLERMGVSNERFEVMIPDYVYEFYQWYENCMKLVEKRDWEGLVCESKRFDKLVLEDEDIQLAYRDYIEYIIARYGEKDNNKAYSLILKALTHTVKDVESIAEEKKRLSVFEWNLFINLYDLKYEIYPDKNADLTSRLYDVYNYHRVNVTDKLIMYKTLPRLALTMLLNDSGSLTLHKRIELEEESLKTLTKYFCWVGLPEVLRLLSEDAKTLHARTVYAKHREALVSILNKYGFSEDFRTEVFRESYPLSMLLSDNLKAYRQKMGLTMEEVSDDICAFESYSRYERGVKYPKRKKLEKLAERLGMEWFLIRAEIDVDDYESLLLATECRQLIATQEIDAFREKIELLRDKIDMDIIKNQILVGFFELLTKKDSGVSKEELDHLFSIIECKLEEDLFHSRVEIDALNYIAGFEAEKNLETGIKIVKGIIDNEKRKRMLDWRYTSLSKGNLTCMYNDSRRYDESYTICRELMDEMIIKDYTFPLMNVLSCLIEAKEEKGNIEQAMKMCKILFYISELYQRHDSEMIREFYERHFDKEAIWY
jgi:hypothetical protein